MIVRYDSANVSYEKVYGVVTNHQGSIMALYDTQGKIEIFGNADAYGSDAVERNTDRWRQYLHPDIHRRDFVVLQNGSCVLNFQ